MRNINAHAQSLHLHIHAIMYTCMYVWKNSIFLYSLLYSSSSFANLDSGISRLLYGRSSRSIRVVPSLLLTKGRDSKIQSILDVEGNAFICVSAPDELRTHEMLQLRDECNCRGDRCIIPPPPSPFKDKTTKALRSPWAHLAILINDPRHVPREPLGCGFPCLTRATLSVLSLWECLFRKPAHTARNVQGWSVRRVVVMIMSRLPFQYFVRCCCLIIGYVWNMPPFSMENEITNI